jgi:hypothetical protein
VIATYLSIDLLKILLAKQFHYKLTQNLANKIRKTVELFLLFLVFSSFCRVIKNSINLISVLEEAGKQRNPLSKSKMKNINFP